MAKLLTFLQDKKRKAHVRYRSRSWGHGDSARTWRGYPPADELSQAECILKKAERVIMLTSVKQNEIPDRLHLNHQKIEWRRNT